MPNMYVAHLIALFHYSSMQKHLWEEVVEKKKKQWQTRHFWIIRRKKKSKAEQKQNENPSISPLSYSMHLVFIHSSSAAYKGPCRHRETCNSIQKRPNMKLNWRPSCCKATKHCATVFKYDAVNFWAFQAFQLKLSQSTIISLCDWQHEQVNI